MKNIRFFWTSVFEGTNMLNSLLEIQVWRTDDLLKFLIVYQFGSWRFGRRPLIKRIKKGDFLFFYFKVLFFMISRRSTCSYGWIFIPYTCCYASISLPAFCCCGILWRSIKICHCMGCTERRSCFAESFYDTWGSEREDEKCALSHRCHSLSNPQKS